jgi:hypothetical protein
MILALAWAFVWGVLQLVLLGSLARTIGTKTALLAMTVGTYFLCATCYCAATAVGCTDSPDLSFAAAPGYSVGLLHHRSVY